MADDHQAGKFVNVLGTCIIDHVVDSAAQKIVELEASVAEMKAMLGQSQ